MRGRMRTAVMGREGEGRFVMPGICIGTSAVNYGNCVTRPTSCNDLHGVCAYIMACAAMM